MEDPHDPAVREALDRRAAELRRDPSFKRTLQQFRPGRTEQMTMRRRRDFLSNGEGLLSRFDLQKQTDLANQGPVAQ